MQNLQKQEGIWKKILNCGKSFFDIKIPARYFNINITSLLLGFLSDLI